jgi:hypothetical protein
MAVITLLLGDSERLDVSSVVAGLKSRFCGTRVTASNSFEAERIRATESMAELAAESAPIKNPPLILQRITNKENTMGPGVDVSVPIDASLLIGHVWAKNIMLSSDDALSTEDIELLTAFLASLGVGKVEVAV